jgi:hypothetical protein
MARNAQLSLRIRTVLKAKLEKLAKQDRRTLSAYVEKVLDEHVNSASFAEGASRTSASPQSLGKITEGSPRRQRN